MFCLINEKIRLKKGIGGKKCISEEFNIKTKPETEEIVCEIKEHKLIISDGFYNSTTESPSSKLIATTGILQELIDNMKINGSMPADSFLRKQESIPNDVPAAEQERMPLPGSSNKESKDFIVANVDQEKAIVGVNDEKQDEASLEKVDFVENKDLTLEETNKKFTDFGSCMVNEKEESYTKDSIYENAFPKETDPKSDSLILEEGFSSFNSLNSNKKCELVLSTYETTDSMSLKETSDIYNDFDSSLLNDENSIRKKDEDLALEIINTLSEIAMRSI